MRGASINVAVQASFNQYLILRLASNVINYTTLNHVCRPPNLNKSDIVNCLSSDLIVNCQAVSLPLSHPF